MNILFIFQDTIIPHKGGVQRVTEILTRELMHRGHNVVFLSTNDNPAKNEYKYIVRQYYIDCSKDKEYIDEEYKKILKEENIGFIINQEPRPDTLYLLSKTPNTIKKITCLHTQPFCTQTYAKEMLKYMQPKNWKEWLYINFCRLFTGYYKRQGRNIEIARLNKSLEVSDCLCLLSDKYIPRVLNYMPNIEKKRLVAVNNPLTFEHSNNHECSKEKTIIWVGRQENYPKNIPAFIDIWKIISQNNKDWKAIIIGDGIDKQYNLEYAKRKAVERLEFAGVQKEVEQYYKKASFIGITSINEGFPMVIVEAMSYACIPCVYNTFESLNDIITNGKNGIIAEPFNKEEIARRIQEVIDDNEKFAAMQKAAIEKAKTFSVENIVDKWEEVFKL